MNTYNVRYLEWQLDEITEDFYPTNGGEAIETVLEGETLKDAVKELSYLYDYDDFYTRRYNCKVDELEFVYVSLTDNEVQFKVYKNGQLVEYTDYEILN